MQKAIETLRNYDKLQMAQMLIRDIWCCKVLILVIRKSPVSTLKSWFLANHPREM